MGLNKKYIFLPVCNEVGRDDEGSYWSSSYYGYRMFGNVVSCESAWALLFSSEGRDIYDKCIHHSCCIRIVK